MIDNQPDETEMSEAEIQVRALLAIAVAYDNRRPSNANITAWMEAANRARWDFTAAREAIHEHYANSAEFLMPAHVTTRIQSQRRQPPPYERLPAIERPTTARPEHIQRTLTGLAANLGWSRNGGQSLSDPVLQVECPYCHAAPRVRCYRLVTRGPHRGENKPLHAPHPSRIDLANGLDT